MFRVVALFSSVCLMIGCGGGVDRPDLATVSGTVTVDGQPMKRVHVQFHPVAGGRPSSGVTDDAGKYELAFTPDAMGAMPGQNRVSVDLLPQYDDDGNELPMEKFLVNKTMEGKTSLEVTNGDNTFDFELVTTDEPPAESDE